MSVNHTAQIIIFAHHNHHHHHKKAHKPGFLVKKESMTGVFYFVFLNILCQSLFSNKVAALRPATLLNKRFQFSSELCESFKNTLFYTHLHWLLLSYSTEYLKNDCFCTLRGWLYGDFQPGLKFHVGISSGNFILAK